MKNTFIIMTRSCLCMLSFAACAQEPSVQHPLPAFGENIPDGYALVYEQDFSGEKALDDFEMSDPKTWRRDEKDGEYFLDLTKGIGAYKPKVRSPHSIALLATLQVKDFIMEVDVEETDIRNGAHRDACFFFGAEDPTHFYYVHLASIADPNAHNIFLVNDAPRTNIAERTTKGIEWGIAIRHRVRIERTFEDGKIRVFFDDMSAPVMETTDKHFGMGQVGFGSFDNTNRFYEFRLYAPEVAAVQKKFFE